VLYFQGEEAATLWDNDSYTIPIEKPGTYTVRMRFANGTEASRGIVIANRGIAEVRFGYPPAPPGNVRAGTADGISVPLSWDSAGSGVSYRVYYGTENNPNRAQVYGGTVSGTGVTVGNLTGNTAYYFWVSAAVSARTAVRPAPANFAYVEGGTFSMGSNNGNNDEKPVHTVTVKSFYIGKYEVTQKEWREIMGSNPSNFNGDNLPLEMVSREEAVEYCNRRTGARTGTGCRLRWNGSMRTVRERQVRIQREEA
jgi:hypothetical protein